MEIKPRGLNESLTIDLEIICDCPCEKPGHPVGILKELTRTITLRNLFFKLIQIHLTCIQKYTIKNIIYSIEICIILIILQHFSYRILNFATQGYQPNAIGCKGKGTSVCGVCSCNSGFYGKQCECEGSNGADKSISMTDCKPDNQTTEICSGHGTCKCGVCDCDKRSNNPQELFYGKYCECDNFSCKRSGGQVHSKLKI